MGSPETTLPPKATYQYESATCLLTLLLDGTEKLIIHHSSCCVKEYSEHTRKELCVYSHHKPAKFIKVASKEKLLQKIIELLCCYYAQLIANALKLYMLTKFTVHSG